MLKVGDRIEIEIIGMTLAGDGYGYYDEQIVIVINSEFGRRYEVEITRVTPEYKEARIVGVIE